jgi:hypothetical protein
MAKNVTTKETQRVDWNNDSIIDSITTIFRTWDKKGNLAVEQTIQDWDANGVTDAIYNTKNEFNKNGQVTKYVIDNDYDANGMTDWKTVVTQKWKGDALTQRIEKTDSDGNGTVDFVAKMNATVDNRGLVTEQTQVFDWEGDGVVDYSERVVNAYNKDGNITYQAVDYGMDGIFDSVTTWEYGEVLV